MKRKFLIFFGLLNVSLGAAGMFVPLLPTVPFLILAAWCFSKSSERLNEWLLNHPIFGDYITNYKEGGGMTKRHKIRTLMLLWSGIGFTFFFLLENVKPEILIIIRISLIVVLLGVTVHILSLNTLKQSRTR